MNAYQNFSMDDIVFENRNKSYGAYELRQLTSRHNAYAFMITITVTVLLIIITLLIPRQVHVDLNVPLKSVVTETSDIPALIENLIPPKPIVIPQTTPPAGAPPAHVIEDYVATADNKVADDHKEIKAPIITDQPVSNLPSTEINLPESGGSPGGTGNNTVAISTTVIPEKPAIKNWVEVMPDFVGGREALIRYLQKHITMDSRDVEYGRSGKVLIKFYVDIDGSIRDAKVLKDNAGGYCAERALAVVNNMPKWKPGRQGDMPVRVYYTLPITFSVQ